MEKLNFDSKDSLISLALNGDENKIIEFDPGDVNFRKKFFALKDELIKKQQELDSKIKKIDTNSDKAVEKVLTLEENFFNYLAGVIDNLFKEGTAMMVTDNRKNTFVLANFIIALVPYFERFNKANKEKYTNKLKDVGIL